MPAMHASDELVDQTLQGISRRVGQLECELAVLRQALSRLAETRDQSEEPREPTRESTLRETWHVTMLGRFRVERDGAEASLCPSRRGRSILKYLLASRGHAAPQSVLIETFWPCAAPGTGAHNLQMAVHALRRSLDGWGPRGSDRAVLFRHDMYLLHPDLAIDQDVERYRRAFSRGERALAAGNAHESRRAFEEARAEYGGEFLSDSPYEDWAEDHRAALQDMQLSLLGHLSRLYAGAAEWDHAAACCREILSVDPYREDAWRQLMRCEAARGRRSEVRTTFERCVLRLRRELRVEPAAETRQLYHSLLAAESAG